MAKVTGGGGSGTTGTSAYTADWTVTIAPEGDVSEDVTEIVLTRRRGADTVTVRLDTSERTHALEEQADITVELTDNNSTVNFDGFVDDVTDSDEEPKVTIDGRTDRARLDDVSLVGTIDADSLWGVIDWVIDTGPGQVRGFSFDQVQHEDDYGLFGGSTDFGKIDVTHAGPFGVNDETFNQHETVSGNRGKQAQLSVVAYQNNTSTTYTMDITGQDANGDTVTASIDLPPGTDAQEAFGTADPKLALSGGNGRWTQVDSISTDIPDFSDDSIVLITANIYNFVKTNYQFRAAENQSVSDFLDNLINYISALDDGQEWEWILDGTNIRFRPVIQNFPATFIFTEGQNVIRPIATRNLDSVKNYIKVDGTGSVTVWMWAYNGDFQWSFDNPHESGEYPDSGVVHKSSPGSNDIDDIDLRAGSISSDKITDYFQALEVAKSAIETVNATAVSGTAPVDGILNAEVDDVAEVYYPSRGIPQKVADNQFTVEKVEFRLTTQEARTEIDFGQARPDATEMIGNVAISEIVSRSNRDTFMSLSSSTSLTGLNQEFNQVAGGGGFAAVAGTITKEYADGTVKVEGDDGEIYDRVEIV